MHKKIRLNAAATAGLLIILFFLIIAVFAPVIAPYDPKEMIASYLPPSKEHILGTNDVGQDIFSEMVYGTRVSLYIGIFAAFIVTGVGTVLALVSGYFGGVADAVIMRVGDMMIAFPDLILAMAIAGILGPSLKNSMIAIAAVSWTRYARLSRSLVLKIRNRTYISAAEISGSRHSRILMRYMLPNALPTMIITAATDIGTIMLSLASLSFLGFGIQPPTPEWGYMLSEGRTYILSSPWLLFCPGLAVFITVVIFNLWGDCIRDMIDPNATEKRRKKRRKRT